MKLSLPKKQNFRKAAAPLLLAAFFAGSFQATADNLFSLKNLERERAALIQDFLDINADPEQRQASLNMRQRQLTDMERMVLRDERLLADNSPMVKRAFSNYELTFLVHAGAENKRSASEQWLDKVSFTNQQILAAKAGFR